MTKRILILRHIFFWLIFIAYEITFLKFTAGYFAPLLNAGVFYSLNIGLFYLNAHVVLDFSFFRTHVPYIVAPLLIIIEIIGYLILKNLLDYLLSYLGSGSFERIAFTQLYLFTNTWRGLYFIGLSIAYWSLLYMVRFKDRNHQMESEQLKSIAKTLELENKYISVENAFLQNQISPHLLFNSLSFIHQKVYKVSAEAGDSVSRLADLMRYSLVAANDSRTVPLSEEVAHLQNLVELCRMRFHNQFYLHIKKKGKHSTVHIIPLVLITLVENMMKHGDMGDKRYPGLINLVLEGNRLSFISRNKKRNTNLYPKSGLGLKNIEKRLNNHYPDRYKLLVQNEVESFIVNLTIDL